MASVRPDDGLRLMVAGRSRARGVALHGREHKAQCPPHLPPPAVVRPPRRPRIMAPQCVCPRAHSTALHVICVMTAELITTITDQHASPGVAAVAIASPTPRSTDSCTSAVVHPGVFGGAFDGDDGASTGLPVSLNEDDIVATDPVQRANLRNRLKLFTRAPIVSRFRTDLHYRPLPEGGNKKGGSWLASEAELVHALSLPRNTIAGAVHRESGEYDILGVTRVTAGICLLDDCSDASAVDVVGSQMMDWFNRILPLLIVDGDESSRDAARR